MSRVGAAALALALSLSQAGCFSLLADAQAGVVSSTAPDAGRVGASIQGSVGMNASLDEGAREAVEHFGPGVAVRSKITRDVQQVALSPHAYWLQHGGVSPYARAGLNLLQFEHVDHGFGFGMMSPYGELGMFVFPVVVSGFVEYDVRFTRQPSEGFFGLQLGTGFGVSTEDAR